MGIEQTLDKIREILVNNDYYVSVGPQELTRPNEIIVDLNSINIEEHFTGGIKLNVYYTLSFLSTDRYDFLKNMEKLISIIEEPMLVVEDTNVENSGQYIRGDILVKSIEVVYFD